MDTSTLFSLEGRTALVTGGSRGIGKMIAAGFIAQGAKVYSSSRKADVCDAVAEELGPNCISLPQDVSTVAGCQMLADTYFQHEKSLDILVNNAGAAWGEPFETFPESGWDKVMDLNVKSMFFVTQKFLPLLKKGSTKENPARVINIGSIDGINTPAFENYVYSASKAAVHHLTRHLSSRLVQDNILVNAIAPGPFPSNMLGSAVAHNYDPLVERNPMKRIGTAEDVGGLAIFLSSRAGNFTVGETIICDGGLTASSGHDLTSE